VLKLERMLSSHGFMMPVYHLAVQKSVSPIFYPDN
jgi:hypothetical protein